MKIHEPFVGTNETVCPQYAGVRRAGFHVKCCSLFTLYPSLLVYICKENMTDFEILTRATPNRQPEVKMQHLKLLRMLLKHEGSFSSSSRLAKWFSSRRLEASVYIVSLGLSRIRDIFSGAIWQGGSILFIHKAFIFVCLFVCFFVCLTTILRSTMNCVYFKTYST